MKTPLEQNIKLTFRAYAEQFHLNEDDKLFNDDELYRMLVEKLMYLTMTQPDISFAVQHLTQFMQQPKNSRYEAVLWVIRYVKDKHAQ